MDVDVVNPSTPFKDADAAILHVDLTIVPAENLAHAARYPVCLNRFTSDISKRTISKQLVRQCDRYEGAVIVKSILNSGGLKEAELATIGLMPASRLGVFKDYAVLESPRLVPERVWKDRDLAVERFLPEKRDGLFCLRMWYFLGSVDQQILCLSKSPVVKGSNALRREDLGPAVPEEMRQMREELGFDFGKFDYVMNESRAVLLDVSRTPGTNSIWSETLESRGESLAKGLFDYIK